MLDDFAARLLEAAQEDFPLDERPYLRLAERLGATEQEVIDTLERLLAEGVVRELSVFLEPRKLGYTSTLACLAVPPDRVDEVGALISAHEEVTHNYERDHECNLWFAVIAPSQADIEALLAELEQQTGLGPIRSLPATQVYKLRVMFHPERGKP